MKLNVGNSYTTRGGKAVAIIRQMPGDDNFRRKGESTNKYIGVIDKRMLTWNEDGSFIRPDADHEMDITSGYSN
jgi:hypothetical protein